MTRIRLAVMSDLHCHQLADTNNKRESFLWTGMSRVPPNRHPIQALLELTKEKNLKADVLICCGDIANKISREGFHHAWSLLQEVKSALESKAILCTIGNHDVGSRSEGDPFKIAKEISPEFPFATDDDNNRFWTQAFCVQEFNDIADFLIINSAHDHFNEAAASRGTLPSSNIDRIDKLLEKRQMKPIRIAVLHHHPVVHSFPDSESTDTLPTGDQLLSVLAKHRFNLVLHGHRHKPHIRRQIENNHNFHILCAGSFSAYLEELHSRTRNVFHLVELKLKDQTPPAVSGAIETWEFNYGKGHGWNPASPQSAEFPHRLLLGPTPSSNLAHDIIDYFNESGETAVPVDKLISRFASLQSLLPDELHDLERTLLKENLKIDIDILGTLCKIGKICASE